ncbi:daple-like protein isoform X2 [Camellia sinensis]|uniref:daple-like protein isoform X2 n=1 Tax=Camellia sinensis TaxID=4442 RepID=UPI001035C6FD|nr:daple-like protein isoform X2 [Camellia sinensis]
MKKFFFRFSASSNGNNNPSDSRLNNQSTDKAENTFRSPRGSSKTRNQVFASQTSGTSPCLRRSLSFSSAVFHEDGLGQKNLSRFGDQNGSPCNSSTISHKRSDRRSSRCRALTPERQSRPKCFETAVVQNANMVEKPGSSSSSRGYYDYLESSSNCSSNVSNKVVDRYIDGEEEQERSSPKSDPSQRNHIGNGAGKRPPRVQYTAPASPTDCMKEKPRSHSFRETKGTQPYFWSRDCVENGYGHESPRRIAKHVIERLSQSHVLPKTSSKEFGPDAPITIEDIYGVSLNRCPSLNADEVSQKGCPPDGSDETTNGYHHNKISVFPRDNYGVVNSVEAEEDVDAELLRKSKEAEERFLLLSEELEEEDFLEDSGLSFGEPALIQKIRNITEEKVSMAHEISAVLQAQIAQRASAREELRLSRAELDSQTRRLEKEKKELQSALEKELDRRSIDWSFKLEKYQTEEHRLRGLISVFPRDNYGVVNSVEAQEDVDAELLRKSKEAEERFLLLSEELEEEDFLEDSGFSFGEPALIQKIRNITEERVSMAHEISAVLQAQIAQRASAREELRLSRAELDSQTRRLEKEKKELQSALEKELDRRSSDWSFKLEKYQAEEHRLRGRVRELAEQNVSLQRDFSSLSERETESRSRFADSEKQLKDLTTRAEETDKENQNLRQNLFELQEKYRAAGEDQDCIKRNWQEKEKECKELHRSIARLIRTCSEQEKTIDGLQKGLSEEVERKASQENFDKQLGKLQMEQIRLTGVEQALRKEVESHRLEVDSLRHENINLLHRLKAGRKDGGFLAFKLDQELLNRVCCMQNQALPLLNESTQLCTKLLEYIKVKASQNQETKQGIEYMKNGLDGQLVVESDMKVQSFKRGTESLTRSLQTISVVLNEKSKLVVESHSHCLGDGSGHLVDQSSEDILRSELKAETLLTSLLREKLYSKEVEVEQLQAELAAGVRGNDMLRCEVQNAMDNLSCMIHKMKDLELQLIKKDENVHRLQSELQECTKELAILKGILPKVSEERDLMWEEVKQYSERNMLLNSEVNVLKKKIEVLDEDVLLKEGQISILKDTLAKPFDLLGSPDSMQEFRW